MADILNIGNTGLQASKKSLETTGHNIANVNTEGYSRQKVVQQTNTPISKSGLIQGTGARVKGIRRTHDPYVEKRLQSATTSSEYYEWRHSELRQVENIFNEIDGDGLNQILNRFHNSFRELANQPENDTIRSVVRDNAGLVVKDFKRIRETLDVISRTIDNKMEGEVQDINAILKNLCTLNKKIAQLEAAGDETSDLRDQRDLAVKELSKSFKVHTYIDESSRYNISAVGVGTLVSGGNYQTLAYANVSSSDHKGNLDGSGEIFFESRPATAITHKFKSGKIASLATVRNADIKSFREKIDNLAYEFANSVNAIHRRGYVNRQVQELNNGDVSSRDSKGNTVGVDFFKISKDRKDASLSLELSDAVQSDLSNVITALNPNSPGDNRIALAISKLQHEKFLDDGTSTIEEHFLKTIGNIGLEVGKAQLDKEQNVGIKVQAQTLKDRVSGVSIDEETANLVRFQHAYEASAKVMQTANEMFQTVLSIKR